MRLTQDKLKNYLIKDCDINFIEITPETSLFESGLLDSIQLLGLIECIEGEAGIKITDSDITIENMDSIEKILEFTSNINL